MRKPDEPDKRAISEEEEANFRAYRRIIGAMDRGDLEELAAALGQVPDSAPPASQSGPTGPRVSGAACSA